MTDFTNKLKSVMLDVIDSYNPITNETETRMVLYTNVPLFAAVNDKDDKLTYLIDWYHNTQSWMIINMGMDDIIEYVTSADLIKWLMKWYEVPEMIKELAWESI